MDLNTGKSENLFLETRKSCNMRDFIFNKEKYTKTGKIIENNSFRSREDIKSKDDGKIYLPDFGNKILDDTNYDVNSLTVEIDDADFVNENNEDF